MGFYSNKLYDFSVNVPTDWKYIENMVTANGEPIQVGFFPSGFNPLLNVNSPQILIIFENLGESKVSSMNDKEVANYYLEKLRNNIPGGKLISSDVKSTSWGWIYTQKFSFPMNYGLGLNPQFITEQKSFVFKDREAYIVAYFATEEYYQRYYTVYLDVLKTLKIKDTDVNAQGGGCLIATATFGSELAPQVQQLRELRDNTLLQTKSGSAFMSGFNDFYYSFSPTIADWERQNPVFKEIVKAAITPLITTLSILNYVNIDSEDEMLGYGIGVIILNIGMYFVMPAFVIIKIKQKIAFIIANLSS
jgi:hypothetical protein